MDFVRKFLLPVGVAAALLAGILSVPPLLRPILRETPLVNVPYAISLTVNCASLLLLAAVIAILGGREGRNPLHLTGLAAPIGRPILFALLVFGPAAAIAGYAAKPAAQINMSELVLLSFIFPIVEEVCFRGLALGALIRISKWRFIPAALLPAAVFGSAHAWQGHSLAEVAGLVAITGIGGFLLGWLFVRWNFNLWPAYFAHAGLNLLWGVFDLGENAIGGWFGNALRLGVIVWAIFMTLLLAPSAGGSRWRFLPRAPGEPSD